MSKIKFEQTEESVLAQDLEAFEQHFKLHLPVNYRKLILKHNGGLAVDSELFDTLLSIKNGKQTVESVISIHQTLEKNIPENYLPIAEDWSGNPITICLIDGDDKDKIVKFYFDTDEEPEVIANSLEELLGVKNIEEL